MDIDRAKLVITGVFVGFAALEFLLGRFLHREGTTRKDVVIEAVCTLAIPVVFVPLILTGGTFLAELLAPQSAGMLAHLPGWAMFAILLVGDDLTQYLWHRASHTSWLYPLHRAHHSAPYMSVRLVYRNNLIYYLFMPGLWISAMLVHWGFAEVYAVYILLKMTVIIGAHSSIPWDVPLYRWRWSRPLMWLVERVISTPATHAAHHGLHPADGVTHYAGNYGNFLFLWDVLFGTAHLTRRRPESFGIHGLEPVGLLNELLVPTPMRWVADADPMSAVDSDRRPTCGTESME